MSVISLGTAEVVGCVDVRATARVIIWSTSPPRLSTLTPQSGAS
jgi:hypothetical protein